MTWWAEQEQHGYRWTCGVCGQTTPKPSPVPRHKPGCPYAGKE